MVLASGTLLAVSGADGLLADQADVVTVTAAPAAAKPHGAAAGLTLPAATQRALDALVARTYVPASEQSRRGAGGLGADNT